MKNITAEMKAHLAQEVTTMATCWGATLTNGQFYGFTDHSRDLVIDGVLYKSTGGYTPTAIETSSILNVDNLDIEAILNSPEISEKDLLAGKWDRAQIEHFAVNWNDLSMGRMWLKHGTLGQITIKHGTFVAEIRGLTQSYTTKIGETYSPTCRATLGDSRCKVDLTPYTATGMVETITENRIFTDSQRTEPGPADGVAITGISRAKRAVVSAPGHTFVNGQSVTLSGVQGVIQAGNGSSINARYFVIADVVDGVSFSIPIDTRLANDNSALGPTADLQYSSYISGGTAYPYGPMGYFSYGKVTFNSGDNINLSMEVKNYFTGLVELQLPMPYQVKEGDTYTIVAGCAGRFIEDCKLKFDNVVNFRGEPHLPGFDQITQVGGPPEAGTTTPPVVTTPGDGGTPSDGGGTSGSGGTGTANWTLDTTVNTVDSVMLTSRGVVQTPDTIFPLRYRFAVTYTMKSPIQGINEGDLVFRKGFTGEATMDPQSLQITHPDDRYTYKYGTDDGVTPPASGSADYDLFYSAHKVRSADAYTIVLWDEVLLTETEELSIKSLEKLMIHSVAVTGASVQKVIGSVPAPSVDTLAKTYPDFLWPFNYLHPRNCYLWDGQHFVAQAEGPNQAYGVFDRKVMLSIPGTNSWNALTPTLNSGALSNLMAYGNGTYVGVATPNIMVSTDLASWRSYQQTDFPSVGSFGGWDCFLVKYINNQFLICGNNGLMLTSADGNFFDEVPRWPYPQVRPSFFGVEYINGNYYACTPSGNIYKGPSFDAMTLMPKPAMGRASSQSILVGRRGFTYVNGKLFIVGTYLGAIAILVSDNLGQTWTDVTNYNFGSTATPTTSGGVVYANGKYILGGFNFCGSSTDGHTWDLQVHGDRYYQEPVSNGSVVVADSYYGVIYTTDGVKWHESPVGA